MPKLLRYQNVLSNYFFLFTKILDCLVCWNSFEKVLILCHSLTDCFLFFSMIMTGYLAKFGENASFLAAMAVSAAWDSFESSKTLEQPINYLLFNKYLARNLVNLVHKSVVHCLFWLLHFVIHVGYY